MNWDCQHYKIIMINWCQFWIYRKQIGIWWIYSDHLQTVRSQSCISLLIIYLIMITFLIRPNVTNWTIITLCSVRFLVISTQKPLNLGLLCGILKLNYWYQGTFVNMKRHWIFMNVKRSWRNYMAIISNISL